MIMDTESFLHLSRKRGIDRDKRDNMLHSVALALPVRLRASGMVKFSKLNDD
jgi:hypothetical protein